MSHPIAVYQGKIQDDTYYFAPIINGNRVFNMILDTGAFELTFSKRVADRLGLPNLGPVQIGGIGGAVQAYLSQCDITIRGLAFPNVPCIVDPSFQDGAGLFGLRFFIDNDLAFKLNPATQRLSLYHASPSLQE